MFFDVFEEADIISLSLNTTSRLGYVSAQPSLTSYNASVLGVQRLGASQSPSVDKQKGL